MKEFSISEEVRSLNIGTVPCSDTDEKINISVLKIRGHLDAHTVPELEEKIDSLFSSSTRNMIIDLSDVEYISSVGMGLILMAQKRARDLSGELKLANMVEKVHRIFDLLGFSDVISIYDSLEDALEAFADNQ